MKILVGLGNPGKKYEQTRHNAGFLAIDFILKSNDDFITAKPSHEFKSEMYTWNSGDEKIIFIKPQTFMNDSGQALRVICNFYKMDLSKDLLVIHDEIDLPFGDLRLSSNSSAAGHNGVKSIIENLGTQNFRRLRIGVESRKARTEMPTDAFVLQNFTSEELEQLEKNIFPKTSACITDFIQQKL